MPLAGFFLAETGSRPLALARIAMGIAAFIRAGARSMRLFDLF